MCKLRLRLPDPLAETPPFFGRADARIGCGCGRARGQATGATGATGATLSALRADKHDRDAARRELRL